MSIAPPSDIIFDVAQAADPQRLQAATTKLNALATASGGASVDFQTLLASAAARPAAAGAPRLPASTPLPSGHATTLAPQMSPYRKFEAVLLQTFVQEMLPKDAHLFGDAASGDAVRSMLAEQLADQLAKSGRIGIARMIEKAHGPQTAAGTAADASEQAAALTRDAARIAALGGKVPVASAHAATLSALSAPAPIAESPPRPALDEG